MLERHRLSIIPTYQERFAHGERLAVKYLTNVTPTRKQLRVREW